MMNLKVSAYPVFRNILLITILFLCVPFITVHAQQSKVNVVLFFSPSCPHCHKVIQEDLPPLLEKFGSELNIIAVNVSDPQGRDLYLTTVKQYRISDDRLGVPALIIGDNFLVGSVEIPQRLPELIEAGLNAGGIPLPSISGLEEILASNQSEEQAGELIAMLPSEILNAPRGAARIITEKTENIQSGQAITTEQLTQPASKPTMSEKFKSDLVGNSISVIVLLGMIGCLAVVGREASLKQPPQDRNLPIWTIPLLAIVGLVVAGYLSYVEITRSEAVCGPVGNCNVVQQSPYARLFGVLPIGVLGVIGYALILVFWVFQVKGTQTQKRIATIGLGLLALFGLVFSIYLTFLEPFVIGATCAWCLTSAIIMTLIFWVSSAPALHAWKGDTKKRKKKRSEVRAW